MNEGLSGMSGFDRHKISVEIKGKCARMMAGEERVRDLNMREVEMDRPGSVRGVELKPTLNRAGCSCGRNNS